MMEERFDDGGPAFPAPGVYGDDNVAHRVLENGEPGMSLRDYFAGQALAAIGLRPSRPADGRQEATCFAAVAADCYALADAMLRARGPGPTVIDDAMNGRR